MWQSGDVDAKHVPDNPLPEECVNQIFCSSSENMSELPDRSVHLMVTSPPYNVGKQYDRDLSVEEHMRLLRNVLSETYRVLVTGGRACVNVAGIGRSPYIPLHAYLIEEASRAGFFMRGEIIWDKGMNGSSTAWGSWRSPSNPTLRDTHEYILVFQKPPFKRHPLNGGRSPTIARDDFLSWTKSIWSFAPVSAKSVSHPAPFPTELPRRLVEMYTFSDEVILDPFAGTGATAIAAIESDRRYVCYDNCDEYVSIAKARIAERALFMDFNQIVKDNYPFETDELSNENLRRYFDKCFDVAIKKANLLPAYACMNCAREGRDAVRIDKKPPRCPECHSASVYEIATFQGRAPVVGAIFEAAVKVLFTRKFNLRLDSTPTNTATHDLEASEDIAIELKGSAQSIEMPGGARVKLNRAGLLRSDTLKKAEANALRYKRLKKSGRFYILTNALPDRLRGIRSDEIDGFFDVTKVNRAEAFVSEIQRNLRS